MKFCEYIKVERNKKGWSQEILGEVLGIGKSTIYNWETERSLPGITDPVLNTLSEQFNIATKNLRMLIINSLNEPKDKENKINYDFLPTEIINFSLSENEVKYLKLEALKETVYPKTESNISLRTDSYESGNYSGTLEEQIDYYKLSYLIDIFGDEKETIETINSIKEKIRLISKITLTSIILKHNLNTLNIQELEPLDIIKILKPYNVTRKLLSNINNGVFVLDNGDCVLYQDTIGDEYDLTSYFIKGNNSEALIREDGKLIEKNRYSKYKCCPYYIYRKDYFMEYFSENAKEIAQYQKEKAEYDIKYTEWQEAMKNFKNLQTIYEYSANTPKLEQPTPPTPPRIPLEYRQLAMTKKGKKLYDFLKQYDDEFMKNIKEEKEYVPTRIVLKKYLNQEIETTGFLADKTENSLLFRDIYKNKEYICDHMWQYGEITNNCNLKKGKYYKLTGIVKTCKKENENIDYHVDINKIKEIED